MNTTPLICAAAFSMLTASATEQISVSLCNSSDLPHASIGQARAETAAIFAAISVHIAWANCGEHPPSQNSRRRFIIRILDRAQPRYATSGPGETMGKAYIASDAPSVYADVYVAGVQSLRVFHVGDVEEILGCAIAHELGHLLLGPRHSQRGVMSAVWGFDDLPAIRQRALNLNRAEGAIIREELRLVARKP